MKTLPLGIDLGETAARIALCAFEQGSTRLVRVLRVSKPPQDPIELGKAIGKELKQAKIRERRCVMTLQDPDATMKILELPAMSKREMEAVAQLEAERVYGEGAGIARIAAKPIEKTCIIGLAKKRSVEYMQAVARAAGLKLQALDNAAYAYARLFPRADAVADIGHNRTRFCALRGQAPWSTTIDLGGSTMTAAIARAYSIDLETAQRRKIERTTAGGAEAEIEALAEGIGRAIRTARMNGSGEIETLILVGNGARIPTLLQRLERDTGCLVELATRQPFNAGTYSADVISAALPDWALALGAASWSLPDDVAA